MMKNADEMVTKMMEKVQDGLSEEEKKEMRGLIEQVFVEGVPSKQALGFGDKEEEGLYSYAYNLYNTGKHEEAEQTFKVLLGINPDNIKHAMGLAASYHMQKKYKQAIHCYTLASTLDETNPLPVYHLSDCYHKEGHLDRAIAALEVAQELAAKQKEYHKLKERIEVLLPGLEKEAAKMEI